VAEPLRVLIVDDHPIFRKGLRALLATAPELLVIGDAASGLEAVKQVVALAPDIVLMDLQMPGGDGLNAIRQLATAYPSLAILVVTMFADNDSVFAALRAGARGYVLKDSDESEMLRAIVAVGHGEAIFSPAIASRMLGFFAGQSTVAPFPELTESERNVLRLMARGLANDTIAVQLALSPKTVRNYVSNIFSKLHVADRAQAVARARDAGLG
jgi:DNA-binding NarL/FixJ family response regulator